MSGNDRPTQVRREEFQKDKVIFEDGDQGGRVFVVEKGRVELSKTIGGEKRILGTLGENEIFGELSVLTNEPRSATAIAQEYTVCLTVSDYEIKERMKSADLFVQALIRILINNLKETTKRFVVGDQEEDGVETADS
ncbi:MAG: cyclic nucleotide-binding domain-containing protein [Alphaproteobacteria bacterium]|jgi:CRP-like cAMP-binding protein|nr:cyclic nucleotide-binding domain-containing protein [Alphaproteobacteria bacterium]MBT4082765.1 cyclic nucleotide-binding domain-containing protein [Alphaproteobacteria bacterium]MBT4543994.1 cyclic nucleotide-binding domain-containing protein [Alphaproteobacteria bacterium]MBT7745181.1 cyclic nucleotide-binding domain-containing protein [Alphaproteobacteria bacterium]